MSHAIQVYAESNGYSVVRELVGHGIGKKMHEPPDVPNYGKVTDGPLVTENACLAIEPMITWAEKRFGCLKMAGGLSQETANHQHIMKTLFM